MGHRRGGEEEGPRPARLISSFDEPQQAKNPKERSQALTAIQLETNVLQITCLHLRSSSTDEIIGVFANDFVEFRSTIAQSYSWK